MRRKHRRPESSTELDITAFMNLMIVLVPVLLLSMVFTQTSIIDLDFPKTSTGAPLDEQQLQLRVAIGPDRFIVSDNQGGLIRTVMYEDGHPNYLALQDVLKAVKMRVPEKRDIVLLAQPTTDYQTLIHTMDVMRSYPTVVAASLVYAELFPDVALGDAPMDFPSVDTGGGQ